MRAKFKIMIGVEHSAKASFGPLNLASVVFDFFLLDFSF